jgi:hypothetical protein
MKLPLYPGKPYPKFGVEIAKLRKGEDRKAHGTAIERAMRALQRREAQWPPLRRPFPVQCASRTLHNTAEEIERAVLNQNRRALLEYPSKERQRRSEAQWRTMYAMAMREKHNAG